MEIKSQLSQGSGCGGNREKKFFPVLFKAGFITTWTLETKPSSLQNSHPRSLISASVFEAAALPAVFGTEFSLCCWQSKAF